MGAGVGEGDRRPGGRLTVSIRLGTSLAALVRVRRRTRELLRGYSRHIVVDAVQLADALASNAFVHGAPPQIVRLKLTAGGDCLRIEADDAARWSPPLMRGWSGSKGLGMLIVSRVAAAWGVQQHRGYKTVWADLAL
jgi:hypothetical protein